MNKDEIAELKRLRDEKEAAELEMLRAWKTAQTPAQAQPLPIMKTEVLKPVAEPPNFDKYFMERINSNPQVKAALEAITGIPQNSPAMPTMNLPNPPAAMAAAPVPPPAAAPSGVISKREAALKIKEHLERSNIMFYICAATPLLALIGNVFSLIAAAVVACSGIIACSFFFVKNRQYITELTKQYGV